MSEGKIITEDVSYYSVPEEKRLGKGSDLFDFLAECIADFVNKKIGGGEDGEHIPLGFTFSFPMTQNALNEGVLVSWTKSFNCSGKYFCNWTDSVESNDKID